MRLGDVVIDIDGDGVTLENEKIPASNVIWGAGVVIPPFLMGSSRRIHAAVFSFMAGVMPPMAMLGRSLL